MFARIVKERISILAENGKEQFSIAIKQAKYFAIQLDETTANGMYMFATKVQIILKRNCCFVSVLELSSRGIDVYNKVNEYFNV